MIRRLRRRHARFAIVWMAACVPLGLVVGLAARRAVPTLPSLPASLVGDVGEPSGTVRGWSAEIDGVAIDLSVWGVGARRYVEIVPREDLEQPDVLVYLARGGRAVDAPQTGRTADDALLIGTLAGPVRRRFALPEGAVEGGQLVLYSLAHQRELGRTDIPGS